MITPIYHVYTAEEKLRLAAIAQANDEALGIDYSAPYVPPEENTAAMREDGVRAKDNIFQRELMLMRYGREGQTEIIPPLTPATT